ncbi:hypothetical protein DPMN_045008 [Dreissena polymorpha]|uniref:Uncharacterized protein n=1 Tax=Dreissena polymorpha TaxID=45954 RepID=A0A9D4D565_DREPO|nr:hypothetical protein DPMN_045008 [Dreissena polymorpha]
MDQSLPHSGTKNYNGQLVYTLHLQARCWYVDMIQRQSFRLTVMAVKSWQLWLQRGMGFREAHGPSATTATMIPLSWGS